MKVRNYIYKCYFANFFANISLNMIGKGPVRLSFPECRNHFMIYIRILKYTQFLAEENAEIWKLIPEDKSVLHILLPLKQSKRNIYNVLYRGKQFKNSYCLEMQCKMIFRENT